IARRPLVPASKPHARIHIHSTPLAVGQPDNSVPDVPEVVGETTGETLPTPPETPAPTKR
ncbi:hypothetical protein N136_03064, partial [Leifsonia aquatica ATCC 14665]